MQSGGEDKELTSYMDQMDEELSRTSIGESFEKVSGICLLHGLSWGLVTEQARSATAGDKGDKREAREGMMGRRARKREVIPLSFVINSNFPTKWWRATGNEAGVGYLFRPRRHQMGYPDIFDDEWKVFRPHYLSRVLFFPNACTVVSACALSWRP